MKKNISILVLSILFFGCQKKITNLDIAKINGYWEIEKAEMPDGTKKEYAINPTIDFFEVKNNKGFRKKVMPQLDGKYLVDDTSEDIIIATDDNGTFIKYTTKYASWKEELISIDEEQMVLKNEHDIEYTYKHPKPFSLK